MPLQMDFYSVWPFFLGMVLIFVVACTPLLRGADSPPSSAHHRLRVLDGLRGFLALDVFFIHAGLYHEYLSRGDVIPPPGVAFYSMLGESGVSLFFMITGYLFWTQLLHNKGRPNWVKLYVGRAFRILPLYWAAVFFVFAGVAYHTGFHLNESGWALTKQVTKWLAGGIFYPRPINEYKDTAVLVMSATWTLHFEWQFYLGLLPLAFFTRSRTLGALFPIILFVCVLTLFAFQPQRDYLPWDAFFLIGMAQGALQLRLPAGRPVQIAGSVVLLILMAVLFMNCPDVRSPLPIVMLGAIFFMITAGASVFGLLTTRAAVRLGDISYGIYLLQGPVLAMVFSWPAVKALALVSPFLHWSIAIFTGILLTLVATAAHLTIERPGIAAGRKLLSRLGNKRSANAIGMEPVPEG